MPVIIGPLCPYTPANTNIICAQFQNREPPNIAIDHRHITQDMKLKEVLEDLGDDDIALGPHLEVKTCQTSLMVVFNRNRSQVFASKCIPSAMSSSPRYSSS